MRARLGVALLIPEPVATELNGLRRALGDPDRVRVPPHITLVPPVNVAESDLDAALGVLRDAAATFSTLALRLGPTRTFSPMTPVLYLAVGDPVGGRPEGLSRLTDLRGALFQPPLQRRVDHPYVAHVTLHAELTPARLDAAIATLTGYTIDVTFDRVHLLQEEQPGRVWRPIAEVILGPPAVIGRGGLPVTLDVSSVAPFDARHSTGSQPFAITARREGAVVGLAEGRIIPARPHDGPRSGPGAAAPAAGPSAWLERVAVVESCRHQGVGSMLLAAVCSHAAEAGCHWVGTAIAGPVGDVDGADPVGGADDADPIGGVDRAEPAGQARRFFADRGFERPDSAHDGPAGANVSLLVRYL